MYAISIIHTGVVIIRFQEVVTYMSSVEAFATRSKLNQAIKHDQGDFQTATQSRTRGCNLTFDPWKSRASEGNNHADQKN